MSLHKEELTFLEVMHFGIQIQEFFKHSSACKIGQFYTFSLTSLKKLIGMTRKSSLNFESYPDSGLLPGSALMEVCALWVFLFLIWDQTSFSFWSCDDLLLSLSRRSSLHSCYFLVSLLCSFEGYMQQNVWCAIVLYVIVVNVEVQ